MGHGSIVKAAVGNVVGAVPFYATLLGARGAEIAEAARGDEPLDAFLRRLPLLTRERIRPTLPKTWFPAGRDTKADLASGKVTVIEVGAAESRVRILFEPGSWREQEALALGSSPIVRAVQEGSVGPYREAILWVPERGTGSCGAGDPSYEERLEGTRLHLNSRQDPTFWTEAVMTRMLDELERHETTALLADPYYLDELARHAASVRRKLAVRGFVATMRTRQTVAQREALAQVYAGPVVDVLASREVGTLFVQMPDGTMQHAPSTTHVELLRAKVTTPGASDVALAVVTTLARSVQPLVRYVLGDLVQLAPGAGSAEVASIATAEGRSDDAIVRPDGALVTAGALDRAIGAAVRAYQIVQTAPDTIEAEVVGDAAVVAAALAPLLEGMRVSARAATAIGVEPNGEYRAVRRRNLPLSLSSTFEQCEEIR